MAKWKLVVGVLLIFSAGVLVGGFITGYGINYFVDRFKKDSEYRIDFILGRLTRELNLDQEQKKEIRIVLTNGDQEITEFWTNVITEADEKVNQVKEEIKLKLKPDQVIQFEEFGARIKARHGGQSDYLLAPVPRKQSQ